MHSNAHVLPQFEVSRAEAVRRKHPSWINCFLNAAKSFHASFGKPGVWVLLAKGIVDI